MKAFFKIIMFIVALILSVYGVYSALGLSGDKIKELGLSEALKMDSYKIVPYIILYIFMATIIPSILLKISGQPKLSIITLLVSGSVCATFIYDLLTYEHGRIPLQCQTKNIVALVIGYCLAVFVTAIMNVKFRRNEPETF